MKDSINLPLRLGVGIILLNKKKEIFVGKRIDNAKKFWQMPQGGINKDENFLNAAKRELKEETGVKSAELIKEIEGWFTYDLPENLLGKIWKGKYRGQKQKWFVMNFTGNDSEININTANPEFLKWKWIKPSKLTDVVVDFKIEIYKRIKNELKSLNLV